MQIGNEKAIRFISAVKFAFPPEGIWLGKVWEILYLLVGLAAKYLNTWKYFSQVPEYLKVFQSGLWWKST